ncbi:MAG: radical SAM protein, partial [bacterium]|nr:radical SAM protein [bacterium]
DIHLGELIGTIETLAKLGVEAVDFTGGEPLFHPGIKEILLKTVESGIKFGLVTNGTFSPEQGTGPDSLSEIIGKHASWIRVSLDTTNEVLFNKIRRPIAPQYGLPQVLNNIASIIESRERNRRDDFRLGVNCVVDKNHVDSIYDTVETLKKMGVDYVRFSYVSAGKNIQEKLYENAALESIRAEIAKAGTLTCNGFFVIPPADDILRIPAGNEANSVDNSVDTSADNSTDNASRNSNNSGKEFSL